MDALGSSAVFETAIGVVVVWFLAATLCSAVVEGIAALGGFRAKHLWQSVASWFSTGSAPKAPASLVAAWRLWVSPPDPRQEGTRPSAHQQFLEAVPGLDPEHLARTKEVNREAGAAALATAAEADDFGHTQLGSLIERLPTSVKGEAGDRAQWLARWFDSEMAQVTAAYRRRIRWWAAAVGLVVVIGGGLDAGQLAAQLYRDPVRRDAAAAKAEQLIAAGTACPDTAGGTTTTTTTPGAAPDEDGTPATSAPATPTSAAPAAGAAEPGQAVTRQVECASAVADDLETLQVSRWVGGKVWPTDAGGWVGMVLGLLASALAVAAGAPLWFSVLQRLMGLRRPAPGTTPS
ncbi:MAG TPA: hypothetical protein VEW93_12695 [Acidimicrobiales bacterium]|nr:hypothetical protein [Acidimicrobiales bacterium]